MEVINTVYQKKLDNIIENNPELAEDTNADNNNISFLVTLKSLFRILKLVIIILNISYFLGFFWFILTDLQTEFEHITTEHRKAELSPQGFAHW